MSEKVEPKIASQRGNNRRNGGREKHRAGTNEIPARWRHA
jgi:hypothetical protein